MWLGGALGLLVWVLGAVSLGFGGVVAAFFFGSSLSIDEYCSQSFSCRNSMDQAMLAERALIALTCADARKTIMDQCFGGRDDGHKEAYESTIRAHENCVSILSGM